jgi:hypothetical protein
LNLLGFTTFLVMCVCVCRGREREREKERERKRENEREGGREVEPAWETVCLESD